MSIYLYATDPRRNVVSKIIQPVEVSLSQELEEPANLTFLMESDWDEIESESDSSNPLQLNSKVELVEDGTTRFVGFVYSRSFVESNGEQLIQYDCLDKYAKIRDTMASINGDLTFTETSPSKTLSNVTLSHLLVDWGVWGSSKSYYLWFPKYDETQCYLPYQSHSIVAVDVGTKTFSISGDLTTEFYAGVVLEVYGSTGNDGSYTIDSSVYNDPNTDIVIVETIPDATVDGKIESEFRPNWDTLGEDSASWDTDIKVSQSYKALLPTGLVRIGDEVIWYDGYIQKSDGYWYLMNIARIAIGSSAAIHSTGDEVIQFVPYKIHPDIKIEIEGLFGGSWYPIEDNQLIPQAEEGRFVSNRIVKDESNIWFKKLDIDEDGEADHPTELTMSYGIFDELSSSVVKFADVVKDVLEASIDNGGAGLTSSTYNVDLPSIRLTRVIVDEPIYTIDFIETLTSELGFQGEGQLQVFSKFYDSSTGKFNFISITQDSVPTYSFPSATKIERENVLEDVYSAVCVVYKYEIPLNKCMVGRWFHPTPGLQTGANNANVVYTNTQNEEFPSGFGWKDLIHESDKHDLNVVCLKITDGKSSTGGGYRVDADPGLNAVGGYVWFDEDDDGACEDFIVDKIKVVLDLRRMSDPSSPIKCRVVGYDTFVPPTFDGSDNILTEPIPGNEINLSSTLSFEFLENLSTDDVAAYQLEASGISKTCQAIGIIWDGMPRTLDGIFWSHIKEVEVYGYENKYVLIKLNNGTDSPSYIDSTDYVAADSYEKMVDSNFGLYKVKKIDVGVCSDEAAVSLGRLALLESLALSQQRTYEIESFTNVPKIGDTVIMADGFQGVVLSVGLHYANAAKTMVLRVLNLDDILI
jgi:hypothetical protein